jgi:DNA-binding MarR family transcriptional regulator
MSADALEILTALQRWGLENDRYDLAVARAHGVGVTETRAVDHLQAAGELTPGELGDALSLTSGAVTALVDRLERAGWVTRSPHPDDRRSVVLRLTDRCYELIESVWAPYAQALADAAAELPAAHRAAVARYLQRAADIAAEGAREWRGSGPAPIGSPGRDSPPTPAA